MLKLQGSMNRSCLCSILITTSLICGVYFIGNAYIHQQFKVVQTFSLSLCILCSMLPCEENEIVEKILVLTREEYSDFDLQDFFNVKNCRNC